MIETKEQIIEHFKSGSKDKSNLKIGVEHEKFIFDKKTNTRIDYSKIKKMFENLYEFGWKPIFEEKNPIALTKNGKSIIGTMTWSTTAPERTFRPFIEYKFRKLPPKYHGICRFPQ